ncbi:helix-turn-helix transcriptional regulator [Paenibacillus sp.]|uniref:helix-turn-helix domain-containing protein n=1 Tax=Paenibacillus sp. TaxID=58172 RepID=UPI002810E0AB|nr:helix-turn-helix transcriptional regulator [Paenibacillus sp.]
MTLFGVRLRELRKKNGLSMAEFGRRIGIAKSTVAGYEGGEREPSLDTVAAIARLFDVTSDYLLGLTDRPHPLSVEPGLAAASRMETTGKTALHWNGEPLTDEELELVLGLLKNAQATKYGRNDAPSVPNRMR